jgi:Bacterial cadherin-like domain/Putative Ig domain
MNASTFRRRFSLVFAALTLTPLLASAAPVAMDFKVLIDSDNKEATGCTVVTTAGLMKGVDHVLTTSVSFDSAAGTGAVTGVTRQVCTSSTLNTFSAPIPVDTTGWPVGVSGGGVLTIETHMPTAALGGVTNMHLGFTAVSGVLVDGVILDDDGTPIIWPPMPGARRHAATLATTRVITLDGADGDWFPIAPIAEGSSTASPLLRFFSMRTYMNASDLYFDLSVQSNKNAPTANDDTYSVERGSSLGVNVPGVLSNDTDPNGKPLTAILISGSGTHHGALTLNADGSFNYTNDGSPAPSDSFEYKANNGSADSNTAHVDINITEPSAGPPPVKPAFTSANKTTFSVGTFGNFNITTTPLHPDVTVTKHSGALPAGVTFSAVPGSGTGKISGTPASGTGGSYPLVLRATNAVGSTDQNFTLIVCDIINVTNPATTTATANTPFSVTFTQTGGSLPVTFSLNSGTLPAGLTLSSGGVLSGTPTQIGSFPITVKVTDVNGCTGIGATYTLTVNCQTITVNNPPTTTGTAGAPFSQTFTASNTIGAVTFMLNSGVLPAGLTLNPSTGVLSGTPTQVGCFPITVKATDANGCTGVSATYNLCITCQTITVTNPANATGTAGAPFSETFTQSGAIGGATFTLNSGSLPAGLTLSSGGVLSGTPTQVGSFPITVKVTDGNGCFGVGPTYNLVINCQTISVTNPAVSTGTVDAPFSQTFTASNAIGGATFTLNSGSLPAGLTLSTAGVLSGTPTVNGSFPITVLVTDGNGCTGVSPTYNLVINCQTITVTNPVNSAGTVDAPFSETFTQTGAHGTATFTLNSGSLPAGLTLSTAGVLSGTPTVNGPFPITVLVTDSNGCTGVSATYNLVINCQSITVTNPVNATGTVDAAFSETFTQSGAHGSATFTLNSGSLPAGLTLSTAGVLSGTPTVNGSFPITVLVTDSNGCTGVSPTYNLVINCQTITVTPPGVNTGTVDAPFSQTFTQSGAHGTATFTLASGSLPAGLTLSTAGVLSGTPTVPGNFPITVLVTDSNGCTGTSPTYNLTINCQTITVTNPANATGTVDAAFSETFTQAGAHGSATFTLNSGSLPAGLTLSAAGVLSGTPTVAGSFPITVLVTDSNGCTGVSPTYNLVINCQTITVTNPVNTTGTINAPFSEQFTQAGAHGTATFSLDGTSAALPTGLTLSSSGLLSGTPLQQGTFAIVVKVTDSNGCTGVGATYNLVINCQTITVTNPATTSFPAGSPMSVMFTQTGAIGGATFSLDGTSAALPTGLTLHADGTLDGTPMQGGTFAIVVKVTDGNGCTGVGATYNLTITCPTITVTNPANTQGTAGVAFSETFSQSGGVGTITWSESGALPTGILFNTSTGVLSGTTNQVGAFPIFVTATDQNGCQGTGAQYNLTINCQTITVTNPANATGTVDAAFSETFTSGGILGTVTYSLASGALPAGLTLNPSTGVLSGTPTVNGNFPIVVRATDTNGCFGDGATYNLTINCQTITVTNPATTTGTVDAPFSQTFTQSGAHGTATFALNSGSLPAGLTLSTAGVLSGTPTVQGSFSITVKVTDSNGCTGVGPTYPLVINCQTITVTNPVTNTGTVGVFFSQTFTQSGGHGTTTFSLQSGTLPTGFTLSSGGVLSGTTNQFGTFPLVIRATDSNGCFGDGTTYNLTINCQTITVTNPANTSGTVNAPFSEQFTQSGGIGGGTFSTASTLPTGLSLSTGGLLSGTPTLSGTFNIVVTYTDGNGCAGTGPTYPLVIACQTISVTNPANSTGTAGSPFSEQFTQTGAVGAPTWSVTGTLPTGITLNTSTGLLSGTTSLTGVFPITVTATDAAPNNACSGTGTTYNLTINCQTITITNPIQNSVQSGTTLSPASDWTFTASGILGTASWTIDSGTLPTGITLSSAGVLSGSSTAQGTYPITVRVTDSANSCFTTSNYTLTVTCPTITVTRTGGGSFPAATFNVGYPAGNSFTATCSGCGTIHWSFQSGTQPPGINLTIAAGTLSGIPSATGTFQMTVIATDQSNGCTGQATFTFTIKPNLTATDSYSNLVNNTQAYVTGGATSAPTTPAVQLSGTIVSNDTPASGVTVDASSIGTFATTQGGSVTIASDGTFLYTPPVTASPIASDTFGYTGTSNTGTVPSIPQYAPSTGPATATGTVTLNLANRVWYVKNNGSNGNGQSQSPFNSLSNFTNAARVSPDTSGDIIYVYNGDNTTTNQNAGIKLLANEQLIGQGVALVVNTNTLVTAGTKPLITNTAGDALTLNNGNTVKGVNLTGPTGNCVTGTNTAGLTMDTMTIQGAGAASSGIALTTPSGTIGITNTAISNSPFGLTINGGTAAFTMNNTNSITSSAGQRTINFSNLGATSVTTIGAGITDNGTGIAVTNSVTGAQVTFTGTQTLSTTTNTAVSLGTNNSAIISFSGTLGITTSTGTGFSATGSGTINVTGTANITTGAAAAGLNLNAITVGGSGITFNTVSTTGATTGINLVSFAAAGTVTVNGGTITNGTTGISLQGANTSLSLANVTVTGPTTGITNTTNFGTLTIGASVNVSAVTALNLTTGAVSGTFANVTSSGGTNGVNLNAVTGTWGATAGTLTGATGSTFNVTGTSGTVTWGGAITQANAANVVTIASSNTNTITFNGNVQTSATSTGINISGSSGTYAFNGATNSIAGSGGGVTIVNESGNVTFGSGTSITAAATSFKIGGTATNTTANITYSGTITNNLNNGILLDINSALGTYSTGTITFNGTSLSGNVNGNGGVKSIINNMTGTLVVNHLSLTSSNVGFNGTLVAIGGTNTAGSFTFNNLVLSATGANHTGKGLTMLGGGTLAITATGGASSIDVGSSALDLNGIALGASAIGTLNSLGVAGANGVLLTNVTGGTLTIGAGAITGNTASAFKVVNGTASVSYGGTITQNTAAQKAVDISGITGGTIGFSGLITSNGGTGVSAAGTGGTVNFTGGMTLNGTASVFSATGAGMTVNVTGTNTVGGTTAVTSGTAVNITCTIGGSNVTFQKVSSTGVSSGIILSSTGSGNFTITGNGTANCKTIAANCDGGTIQTSTGPGMNFTTVNGAVSLTNVNVTGGGDDGIRGNVVGGFTLVTSQVTNNGNATTERGIEMTQLTGSGAITNSTITGNAEDNFWIQNSSGTLSSFNVTGSTFSNTSTSVGNDGIHFEGIGTAHMTISVTGCTFNHNRGDHFQANTDAANTGVIQTITFSNNTLTGDRGTTYGGTDLGGGITINPGGAADVTYTISNNGTVATPWTGAVSSAIMINSSNSSVLHGTLSNNVIGTAGTVDSGSSQGDGISVFANNSSAIRALITNNTIKQYSNLAGLNIQQRSGSATVQAVATGNTIANGGSFASEGIFVSAGTVSGDSGTMCLDLGGAGALANSIAGSDPTLSGNDFRVRQRFLTTIRLPGYGGTNQDTAAVVAFLQGRNNGNGVPSGTATVPAPFTGGGFIGGAACTAP